MDGDLSNSFPVPERQKPFLLNLEESLYPPSFVSLAILESNPHPSLFPAAKQEALPTGRFRQGRLGAAGETL